VSICLSVRGLNKLAQLEAFSAKPYQDTGGVWTIGYGHVITRLQAITFASGISIDTGQNWLRLDSLKALSVISQKLPHIILQHQIDALCFLVFNIGVQAFENSTIYERLFNCACDLSPWLWYEFDDHHNPVLLRRREIEVKLFVYGIYD